MRPDTLALHAQGGLAVAAQHLKEQGFRDFAELPRLDDLSAAATEQRAAAFEMLIQRARLSLFPSPAARASRALGAQADLAPEDVAAADVDPLKPLPRSTLRPLTSEEAGEVEALRAAAVDGFACMAFESGGPRPEEDIAGCAVCGEPLLPGSDPVCDQCAVEREKTGAP